MTEEGSGKIVDITSVPSQLARQTVARSSATKGGLVMLTTRMAADVVPSGVRLDAIPPGCFATDLIRAGRTSSSTAA